MKIFSSMRNDEKWLSASAPLAKQKPRITYLTINLLDNLSTQTLTRLADGDVQHKIDDGQGLKKNT